MGLVFGSTMVAYLVIVKFGNYCVTWLQFLTMIIIIFVVSRQEMLEKLADKFERKVNCLIHVS